MDEDVFEAFDEAVLLLDQGGDAQLAEQSRAKLSPKERVLKGVAGLEAVASEGRGGVRARGRGGGGRAVG